MAVKYYCDGCEAEISQPSQMDPRPIATIEIIDPATGKQISQMFCKNCTPKLKDFVKTLKK